MATATLHVIFASTLDVFDEEWFMNLGQRIAIACNGFGTLKR
jgi:hypothetical protein